MKRKGSESDKRNQIQMRVDTRNEHFKQVFSRIRETAKLCECKIRVVLDCGSHLVKLMVLPDGFVDYLNQVRIPRRTSDTTKALALQCDDVLDRYSDSVDVPNSQEDTKDDSNPE